MILAGASVDDVFVIVLFTGFLSLAQGDGKSFGLMVQIPVSILIGILVGIITGICIVLFFKKVHMRDSIKLLIMLSVSFLLLELENQAKGIVPISGLLAIMSMGVTLLRTYPELAKRFSIRYNKLWVAAELRLFVLVGASLDVSYAVKAGVWAVTVVLFALVIRMIGVWCCTIKTPLNTKERVFSMFAYIPKATVQAAIGGIPLAMGLACGQKVLTLAILSILITAPVGALLVDCLYKRLLSRNS